MSVMANIVELVTSSLTTKHAEEMALPNTQSNRVRVTKPRAARGAAGCGASRSHCMVGAASPQTTSGGAAPRPLGVARGARRALTPYPNQWGTMVDGQCPRSGPERDLIQ